MSQQENSFEMTDVVPLIPLRDLILFPNLVVPLFVGRERSIRALEEAMRQNHVVALMTQRHADIQDPRADDLYEIGCLATVMQELKLPDGTAKALVEGQQRFRIQEFVQIDPYIQVRIERIEESTAVDVETQALMRALIADFEKAAELGKPIPQEVLVAASAIEEPGRLGDFITFHLSLKVDEKQKILEAIDPHERLDRTARFLRKELEILELGSKIQSRVQEQMTKSQREYFLREHLKAISRNSAPSTDAGRDRRIHREDHRQHANGRGGEGAWTGRLEKMPRRVPRRASFAPPDWLWASGRPSRGGRSLPPGDPHNDHTA
jgi:ATP-dependent Lon protease